MYPLHVLINRFSFINQFISVLQIFFTLLRLFQRRSVNILRGFHRSSSLSLAFSFPSSEGVFMSVVVDMNEVLTHDKTKLNTQAISIGIVYIIVCNSLMLFLPHSHNWLLYGSFGLRTL